MRRKSIDIFNYSELIKEMPYHPHEIVIDNNFYGLGYSLKRYIQTKKKLDAYIEHGLYFGNLVHKDELRWYIKKIITFSHQREKHILHQLPATGVIKIGPYIHYAKNILSNDEMKKVKINLGKTLLVFPSHSIKKVNSVYSFNDFIEEIEKIRINYQTVLICLFFIDAQNNDVVDPYLAKGYKIVTAGHRFDDFFLDRLRTLIELSDMTISNKIGTHLGYCVYLNKPHYIFNQKVEYQSLKAEEEKRLNNVRNSDELVSEAEEMNEVIKYFSEYSTVISDSQKNIVNKYWGIDEVKSQDELKLILG